MKHNGIGEGDDGWDGDAASPDSDYGFGYGIYGGGGYLCGGDGGGRGYGHEGGGARSGGSYWHPFPPEIAQ